VTSLLSAASLGAVQAALVEADLDGWLLFDFRGVNPIAAAVLDLQGMVTRRVFAFVPRDGAPVAITHAIEQTQWARWPREWRREIYSSWRTLESLLAREVGGKRIAMEYSPGDAVPYLDRTPAGVLEMVRAAGALVVPSDRLVSRFYAAWSAEDVASHARAAALLAATARDAITLAGERARGRRPISEYELMRWILDRFAREGLVTDHGPNVSVGPNAANPHYEPTATASREIGVGDVLLIDLWAHEARGVFADQTWMGTIGPPSVEARTIWEAVRTARDAAIDLVVDRVGRGAPIRGAEVDDAARSVIVQRGYGEYFTHRTGHSIDPRDLHGSGPHLDNLETREERLLVTGVAFSIEPGIYIPGRLGVRSEVNVYLEEGRAVVTPAEYQSDLIEV
jgi:Xaa-Pro dipeptidase